MKRRLRENIEIGDSVLVSSDEFQGTVIDINGDEVLVDGPFGEEYFDINDLEKLGGDYEEDETPNFFKKRFTESKRKKIIRLTESELTRIVRRVVNEQQTVDAKPKKINFMSDKISGVIDYSGYGVKIEGKNELGNYFKPARTVGVDFKRGEFPETEELLSIVDKFLQTNNLMSNVKLQQEIKRAMGQMIYYIRSIEREYNRSIQK